MHDLDQRQQRWRREYLCEMLWSLSKARLNIVTVRFNVGFTVRS
jgi:hypothetical protein